MSRTKPAFNAINDGTSNDRVYHRLIGPRRLSSLDDVSHKAACFCLMLSAGAPERSGGTILTTGSQSRCFFAVVSGSPRVFGCVNCQHLLVFIRGGARLGSSACRCRLILRM